MEPESTDTSAAMATAISVITNCQPDDVQKLIDAIGDVLSELKPEASVLAVSLASILAHMALASKPVAAVFAQMVIALHTTKMDLKTAIDEIDFGATIN